LCDTAREVLDGWREQIDNFSAPTPRTKVASKTIEPPYELEAPQTLAQLCARLTCLGQEIEAAVYPEPVSRYVKPSGWGTFSQTAEGYFFEKSIMLGVEITPENRRQYHV